MCGRRLEPIILTLLLVASALSSALAFQRFGGYLKFRGGLSEMLRKSRENVDGNPVEKETWL